MCSNSERLRRLVEAAGIAGSETGAAHAAMKEFEPFADKVELYRNGSVVAVKHATRKVRGKACPRLLLDAHLDEIGLVVTKIEDNGCLRVASVGGYDVRILPSQEVVVHGRRALPGVIGSKPPHLLAPEDRARIEPLDELFVDIGLSPAAVRRLVQIGDFITAEPVFGALRNSAYACKAMDDRTGILVLLLVLEGLQGRDLEWDVYCVAASQEEFSGLGAITCTFKIAPTAAVAIDVTQGQAPGLSEDETFPMGKGPCIALGPNIHGEVYERLCGAAKAEEIPYQIEAVPGVTGTDAGPIQVCQAGIPTGLVSIPLRYMHTTVETVFLQNVERTARLLVRFAVDLKRTDKFEHGSLK